MKSSKNIFLTGATGILGSHILRLILEKEDSFINLLIRGRDKKEAKERSLVLISQIYKDPLDRNILKRINIIKGEITEKDLGIEKEQYNWLCKEVDEIYHCAALAEFKAPLKLVRLSNVEGTRNILDFALKFKRLQRIHYISSAFIAGNKKGVFSENDFSVGQEFNNPYEQSKFEAEFLVREYIKKDMKISIYRPSIIVGEYYTGATNNFRMFYQPLRLLATGLFKTMPLDPKVYLNLIPVDIAAGAIYVLASKESKNGVYHIVSPQNISIVHIVNIASSFFGFKKPQFISLKKYKTLNLSLVQHKLLEPFIPYFNLEVLFDSKITRKILKKYNFESPVINDEFLYRILRFCVRSGFIKISQDKR